MRLPCRLPVTKAGFVGSLSLQPGEVDAASLNSFVLDYCAGQKLTGNSLNYFILKQLPVLAPTTFEQPVRWCGGTQMLKSWLLPRALELTYTAWDLQPFARGCGWNCPPFRWDEDRRFLLRCELDATFFHLYLPAEANGDWRPADGESAEDLVRLKANFLTPRDAVVFMMETFHIVKRKDEGQWGEYRTKRVILEIYDAMAEAIRTRTVYQTRLDPPPADPRCRHPKKKVGILAFGSLIQDLGEELQSKIFMRMKTKTPFPVEYARSSTTRGGAPTLVPHGNGSPVAAEILVLNDEVTTEHALDMLWRRETRRTDTNARYREGTAPSSVLVQQFNDDPCVEKVLYTNFSEAGKLQNPAADDLARRAIQSVHAAEAGKDGITYLMDAIAAGIETPLTQSYRSQILEQTNAISLQEALRRAKKQVAAAAEGGRA